MIFRVNFGGNNGWRCVMRAYPVRGLSGGVAGCAAQVLAAQEAAKGGFVERSRKRDAGAEGELAAEAAKAKKKRRHKPRLPKGFDPANPGPPPDPERWLPLRERSTWKSKRKLKGAPMKGAQGAAPAAAMAAPPQQKAPEAAKAEASPAGGSSKKKKGGKK